MLQAIRNSAKKLLKGFRLLQVKGGMFSKIRYFTLRDLRQQNFVEPWEPVRHHFPIPLPEPVVHASV